MISTFMFLSLLAVVYGTINSGRGFAGVQDNLAKMQMDARRVLGRLSSELRMTGWLDNAIPGEPKYPYVFTNGVAAGSFAGESHLPPAQHVDPTSRAFGDVREIVIKIPVDLDGDGSLEIVDHWGQPLSYHHHRSYEGPPRESTFRII